MAGRRVMIICIYISCFPKESGRLFVLFYHVVRLFTFVFRVSRMELFLFGYLFILHVGADAHCYQIHRGTKTIEKSAIY